MTEAPAQPERKKSETRDFLEFLLKLAVFVFLLRSLIVSPFSIPSESMLPRLMVGDYLLVTKWDYGYSRHSFPFSIPLIDGRVLAKLPERGDVVVFKAPPGNDTDYIKRAIGLPGDLIELRGGTVSLNGVPLRQERQPDYAAPVTPNSPCVSLQFIERTATGDRCRYPRYRETLPGGRSYFILDLGPTQADDTPVFTVPAGHVFMMGDNRDRSADSRFPAMVGGGIGMVPIENLVGKARVSVFSTDGSANLLLPWTWFTAARWSRIGEGF